MRPIDLTPITDPRRYPDRCNACIRQDADITDDNSHHPRHVTIDGDGMFTLYACRRGHIWTCGWAKGGIGLNLDSEMATTAASR